MAKEEKKGKVTATEWVSRETSPEEGEEVVFEKVEVEAIPLTKVEDKFQAPTFPDNLAAGLDEVVEVAAATSEEGHKKATGEDEELEQIVCECKEAKPKEEEKATVAEKGGSEELLVLKGASKPQEPTFADKLADTINEAGEVAAAAVVVGYKKAEAFVKSKEFKQGVETTKKTTVAVAGGLYRGFGKLIKEVELSVKEVKSKEIPPEDPAKKY